jgi:hypothetical protein
MHVLHYDLVLSQGSFGRRQQVFELSCCTGQRSHCLTLPGVMWRCGHITRKRLLAPVSCTRKGCAAGSPAPKRVHWSFTNLAAVQARNKVISFSAVASASAMQVVRDNRATKGVECRPVPCAEAKLGDGNLTGMYFEVTCVDKLPPKPGTPEAGPVIRCLNYLM